MRKQIAWFSMLGLFLLLSLAPANGQIRRVKLPIPFEFTAQNETFPADMYSFTQDNPNVKLAIRSTKGKDGVFSTTNLVSKSPFEKDKTWLIFHKYGEKYFLSEVWAHHLGVQLPVGTEEKALRDGGAEAISIRVNSN